MECRVCELRVSLSCRCFGAARCDVMRGTAFRIVSPLFDTLWYGTLRRSREPLEHLPLVRVRRVAVSTRAACDSHAPARRRSSHTTLNQASPVR